ncbi:TPA: hypothetical protein N0F65_008066 [Lagenidium giganteum]|uniref:GOST seven transmembrane domain-containing protein n=1 Tax=Lagenidium giganteum TaxID=4803 RepID=A0AAV2YNG5_9STRA|nr:TPA: hypothetical protein N0F65_008066 [Lagenidium giganteum]
MWLGAAAEDNGVSVGVATMNELAQRSMRMLVLVCALLAMDGRKSLALGSIHALHAPLTGSKMTERMFADAHGPWGIGGRSVVTVNASMTQLDDEEVSDTITIRRLREYFDFGVVVVSYTSMDRYSDVDERSICSRNFSDPVEGNVDGFMYGEFHEIHEHETLNVSTTFYPATSGLQVVMIVTCWKQKSELFGYPVSTEEFSMYPMVDALLYIDATISFRNPYGYLPALLYGLFPFSACLSLLYSFVDISFIVLINRHRKSTLSMQFMLLGVLLLATGESFSWFFTYKVLNDTGQTVCCPYPATIVISTMIKILAGMAARIATTLICLGYGIVRRSISGPEILMVSGLGVCYFISVGALEISHILNQSDGEARPPAVWEFLVIATNGCFGAWIFLSLSLTRKNLAAFGQTVKLAMYTRLYQILCAYVLASFFLMAVEGAVYSGTIWLDWKYIWLIWAANRLLTFSILLVVTIIWRPSSTSMLYAQMEQIPMRDPSTPSGEGGVQLTNRVPCAIDETTESPLASGGRKQGSSDSTVL